MNTEDNAAADLETRRRRAAYRAMHRGTKEMDWLLGRFAEAQLGCMDSTDLTTFERLLTIPDPELHQWILRPAMLAGSDFLSLIVDLRRFHGLESSTPTSR